MASLLKKKISGGLYYYYVECKRVNKKPSLVKQIYLGTAEQVLKKCQGEPRQLSQLPHFQFGLPVALWQVAEELGLVNIINRFAVGSTPSVDVGQMLVIAAINRACEPKSKNSIIDWWKRASLAELFCIAQKNINGKRFWDAMDRFPIHEISAFEEAVWENVLKFYQVPMDILLYDTTNFYTFMQSGTKSELCQRGHNKAGRHNLRQVGLAVAAGRGVGIPIISQIYCGSIHDATLFPTAITTLTKRVRKLVKEVREFTLIFDKGNNSLKNISAVSSDPNVYMVGSLCPSQFPELLKFRLSRFKKAKLSNGKELSYFKTTMKVFDRETQVVVTYNDSLKKKQEKTFTQNLGKCLARISQTPWERVKDREANLREILDGRLTSDLFVFKEGENPTYVVDTRFLRVYRKRFGKNLIFSTNLKLTAMEMIEMYRDRNELEDTFKDMNDPERVSLTPIRHWTDQKIIVHALICILGLLLLRVLEHKICLANPKASIENVLELLRNTQCIAMIHASGDVERALSFNESSTRQWLATLGLDSLAEKLGIQIPGG